MLDGVTNSMDMNLGKPWEVVRDGEAWRTAVHGGHKELDVTWQLNNNIHTHSGEGLVNFITHVCIFLW